MQDFSPFAATILAQKYSHVKPDGTKETWEEVAHRVVKNVFKAVHAPKTLVDSCYELIRDRKFIPGGRYLFASGLPFHQVQNCLLLRADDSREGWSDLVSKSCMAMMSDAGIGVDYSDVRPEGRVIRKKGGTSSGPLPLMEMVNQVGRGSSRGGNGRGAIWAGLNWTHADIHKFITFKNWSPVVREEKAKDFNFPATMDVTNISTQLDDRFFKSINDEKASDHSLAHGVYFTAIRQMLKTGEPGFSVDTGKNAKETLRNACTEVTSADDSDICNLGSINLAKVTSLEELKTIVEIAAAFLLAGTVYSDVPYAKVDQIRSKNRRLGLGLMGIHEWLLVRGKKYGEDAELGTWLAEYAKSGIYANKWAEEWELSNPVKTRALAPNGSIGILGETTTSLEPIPYVAYKRRYRKGDTWSFQYVVDPTAQRLIENGVDPDNIEDAYTLADDVERRVSFQAWVQKFVDHSISSTINLPAWGSEANNDSKVQDFGKMVLKYLPNLRGLTVYPDGARNGQPISAVSYKTAMKHIGEVFYESADVCELRGGSTCGA